jgi:hypothetical protein
MKADPTTDIPSKSATAAEWIEWYNELSSSFGKKIANSLWLRAWTQRGSSAANTVDLRAFMNNNGISIPATNIFGTIEDEGKGFVDGIGNLFNTGKYLTFGLIGIGAVSVIIIAIGIARHPQSIATVLKAA